MALSPSKSRRTRFLTWILVLLLGLWLITTLSRQAFGQSSSIAQEGSTGVRLTIKGVSMSAELADTPERRARGLMYRTDLGANAGMLFIFDRADRHCMWMRNTPLPLSVAFADAAGRIINIADMTPFTETAHCASSPATFALETRQGWFSRNHLGPGDRLEGLPRP
ncbi:MAG: hypothetical protein RLZZ344_1325 [Pseudomonadota bacterium]|jgi:uncharacterized membrane protein (UPF0127 family)